MGGPFEWPDASEDGPGKEKIEMKPIRFALFVLLVSVPTLIFAQSAPRKSPDEVAPADSQKAFEQLKTLAGSWVGQLTTFPQDPRADGKFVQFSLRVASKGHVLMHEICR
jgi:hypothetical protein